MGVEPSFIQYLRGNLTDGRIVVRGVQREWLAPFAVFDAPNGFDEEVWTESQPQTLIAIRLGGSDVVSQNPGAREQIVTSGSRKFCLQSAGGCSRYQASKRIRFAHFYVTDGLLSRVADGFRLDAFTHGSLRHDLVGADDPELCRLVASYGERATDHRFPASQVEMEARALLVVERLIGRHHLERRPIELRGGLAPWQLKRAQAAMEARLDADMGLDDLARIVGCSPTHFSRAFKQSTGVAPFLWLNQRRIEKAKDLLSDPRLSLAQIALAVGFSAQPQFTTAFGRATGITPGAWRRERLA